LEDGEYLEFKMAIDNIERHIRGEEVRGM